VTIHIEIAPGKSKVQCHIRQQNYTKPTYWMLWRRDQEHHAQAHRRGKILLCIIWWNHRYLTFLPINTLCVLRVPEQQTWRFSCIYNVHDSCFKGMSSSYKPKVNGQALGQLILKIMKELHLDVLNCIGVATDGCALMVSEQIGAVAEIKKKALNASSCPCFNHALNLSMYKTSSVSCVCNN